MTNNDKKAAPPLNNELEQSAANLARVWQHMAVCAHDIAAAKRTLFLAYVAEGFTEVQALDLAKTL